MSTIQSSGSVQDLARTLMQTFEANRDANARQTADDFSTFLGRLLIGVSATGSTTESTTTAPATPAATTSPASTTDLRFQGLDLSVPNDPLKSAKK